MENQARKRGMQIWMHPFIMAILMLSGWFVPTFGTVTVFGVKVLGIFLGMMWGWIFVNLVWPSLLGMLMLSMCGLGSAKDVFGSGFGSEIVLLVIFFSIFTSWLEEIGLTKYHDPMDVDAKNINRQAIFIYFYDFSGYFYLWRFCRDLCNNLLNVGNLL